MHRRSSYHETRHFAKHLKQKYMKWTEPAPPTKGISHYDHVICETPLGQALIEWKGWKANDSYSITIDDKYIGDELTLPNAKEKVVNHLFKKMHELSEYLTISNDPHRH